MTRTQGTLSSPSEALRFDSFISSLMFGRPAKLACAHVSASIHFMHAWVPDDYFNGGILSIKLQDILYC